MEQCLEKARRLGWIPIAEEIVSSKRKYLVMPVTTLVDKLANNHFWNEIIMKDIRVKVYFDIDDKESKDLNSSINRVNNLVKDYSDFLSLSSPRVCTITSHGMLSDGTIKYSYTVIFIDHYYNNNNDQKNLMKVFLLEAGKQYNNIVDTSVYNKNSNLRMVNQLKRGQTRVNKLEGDNFSILDTIISYTKECTKEVINEKMRYVIDMYLKQQQNYSINTQTDVTAQHRCKPLLIKILDKLPDSIHKDYNTWWNVVKLIKRYGDYNCYVYFNNKNPSKVDRKQNLAIWESTDGKFFSKKVFCACVNEEIVKDLEWLFDSEKRFYREKLI